MPLTWTRVGNYCITTGHWEWVSGKETVVNMRWTISIAKVGSEWIYTLWKGGSWDNANGERIESSTDLEFLKSFAESQTEPDVITPVVKPLSKTQRELLEEIAA